MPTDNIQEQTAEQMACPSCSGPMVFNPSKQSLSCEFCDFEKILAPEGELPRYDFYEYEKSANHSWGMQTKNLHCDSCGANTTIEQKDVSLTCPFCGSKHIVEAFEENSIRPHAVIPFKLSRQEAYDLFEKWIKKRFFAKKAVKSAQDAERLKGVYIPFWHFNTETSSYYTCQIGYNYTVTVTKTVMENGKPVTKHVQETRIRWVHKSGLIDKNFNDLIVNASEKFNSKKINALEPFDYRESKPYDQSYLSGFIAERYSVSLTDGFNHLKSGIQESIIEAIKRRHNGDHIRSARLNTSYTQVDFQHMLLPVWLSSYHYNSKDYQFGINGQTGEVQGTYPIDWVKVTLVAAVIIALISLYFIYQKTSGGYDSTLLLWALTYC